MKFLISFLTVAMCLVPIQETRAKALTPVSVRATSQFSANPRGPTAAKLIDRSGLSGSKILEGRHGNLLADMWLSGCVYGDLSRSSQNEITDYEADPLAAGPVSQEILEFDLGAIYDLDAVIVCQYNEWNEDLQERLLERGLQTFEVLVSKTETGDDFTALGVFELLFTASNNTTNANIVTEQSQRFDILEHPEARGVRRVRFAIETSWGDTHVGLSEVRFDGREPNPDSRPVFRRGDHDGSGRVDLTDPLNLLGFLILGTTPPICLDASDADNSGTLDITDSIKSLSRIFLGLFPGEHFPPGREHCGIDPTEALDPDGPGSFPEQPGESLGCNQYPSTTGVPCDEPEAREEERKHRREWHRWFRRHGRFSQDEFVAESEVWLRPRGLGVRSATTRAS
jgi:hypothetical protein